MGCWEHNLVRYRNGQIDAFEKTDGLPDGSVLSLYVDHAGRLWASTTRGGLVRIDHPESDRPQFRVYSTKDGLSSNNVRSINEDLQGRIYAWTGVALDRLEPESGVVIHYTTAEGAPESGGDSEIFRDRQGSLWFSYPGVSRLDPLPMTAHPSDLPIYVKGIRIRGVALPLSELGETQVSGLVFAPNQNNLQIEFGSLNFRIGEVLRYQYKFDGTTGDWSPPSDLRTVNYAELRPGNYRFLVRAINSRSEVSASPAAVSFRILAPIWARWWFLTLMAALVAFVVYLVYQYRVNSLLELERVRTKIASDLHDDIGSGLTQIAILSEVARQSENVSSGKEVLSRMGDLSRELVDGMGEIVWALNPQRDQVADLVQRMRRFASDVLVARGIEFEFRAPASDLDLPVRSDVRRNLYLIFKEAINNSVRHSGCNRASITLSVDKNELRLTLSDNGKGLDGVFDGNGRGAGRGLSSMKERAAELGGVIEITSSPGQGTLVTLVVPLRHRVMHARKITT